MPLLPWSPILTGVKEAFLVLWLWHKPVDEGIQFFAAYGNSYWPKRGFLLLLYHCCNAGCGSLLVKKNHVLSPARLSKSILLSTPIADLERTCLYSIARESPPTALPTALLLNDTSGEHLVNRFAIASMTFCASSEGLTTASTLSSIFDVMLGFPKLYSLYFLKPFFDNVVGTQL